MKLFKEFKEFAMKGNVIDLAVGVIIGGAFGKIVTSLVNDVIMPLLSFVTRSGALSFENLFIALDGNKYETLAAALDAGASTFNYCLFMTTVLDFLIIWLVIFLFIKQINRFKKSLNRCRRRRNAVLPHRHPQGCRTVPGLHIGTPLIYGVPTARWVEVDLKGDQLTYEDLLVNLKGDLLVNLKGDQLP